MSEEAWRRFYGPKNEEELLSLLEYLYEQGYRYVVNEENGLYLTAYEFEPKYNTHGLWGYSEKDLSKAPLMAYPIETDFLTELHKPILINEILQLEEEIEEPEHEDQLTLF